MDSRFKRLFICHAELIAPEAADQRFGDVFHKVYGFADRQVLQKTGRDSLGALPPCADRPGADLFEQDTAEDRIQGGVTAEELVLDEIGDGVADRFFAVGVLQKTGK